MTKLITIDNLTKGIGSTTPVAGRGVIVGGPSANGRSITFTIQPSAAVYNAFYRGLVTSIDSVNGTCVCAVTLDSGPMTVTVKVNKSLLTGSLLNVGDTFVFCSMAITG